MSVNQIEPLLILRGVESLVYLLLILLALRRRERLSAPWLLVYALAGFAFQLVRMFTDFGWLPVKLSAIDFQRMDQYGAIVLALVFYQTLRVFFEKEQRRIWLVGAVVWTLLVVILQNVLLVFVTWLVFTGLSALLLLRAVGQMRHPLQRSRLIFWIPIIFLTIANDILIIYRDDTQGGYLRLGATALMAYVILRHHIPDTRDLTRQFLIYITTTLLTMSVYIAGFLFANYAFMQMPGYNQLLVGAGLAVVISLIFSPLVGSVRSVVNRMFKLQSYDSSQILSEYSASVSNILDLEKLATVAVGLIMETLEIKKGFLFLVDPEIGPDNKNVFRLKGVRPIASSAIPPGFTLEEDSPVARFLREERKPLLQYDVDFAPEFMDAPLTERKWLSELGLYVYVPIYSKGEWIGLLALGPKPFTRYTDEDLTMLSMIANQTAVALENARLVENLKQLNAQVREAYSFLDKANHDLAQLELTKSNFISIASHELRTPLTVARGYTEMLLESDMLSEPVRDLVKGIHKSTLRLHEIMDSMFDIAQIDARTLELHRQDVFLTELIRSVAQEQAKIFAERHQEISLDLPSLPSIKADPNTLEKLFYHLISNAIKFTPDGGKISITAKQVSANNRDLPEGGVEVVVSDTGVGIDKSLQEVIFTKFYQPGDLLNRHSTGKTKFKGSGAGLGLALSRGIVEAHGGRIWVESPGFDEEKCPGSQFHFILPLRSQSESKTVRMGSAVKLKL
ncbi:MAG: ATP-binding protein [Anaerolineales bacterium]